MFNRDGNHQYRKKKEISSSATISQKEERRIENKLKKKNFQNLGKETQF